MVVQEDDFGCGVACVANLLSISYQSSLELFEKKEYAKFKGFWPKDIVTALQKTGVYSNYRYVKPKTRSRIYNMGTIVFLAKSRKYPCNHYILCTNQGWLDPWINLPQTPRKVGIRKRLPGRPIYAIFLVE